MNHPVPVQLSLMPVMPALPADSRSAAGTHAAQKATPTPSVQADREEAATELQGLLTELFLQDDPAQCLLAVTPLVPQAHRAAWHLVTHTLLARRLALGSPSHLRHAADAHTLAWSLARQWEQPVLLQRWQRLVSRLTARQCQQLTARLRRQMKRAAALH